MKGDHWFWKCALPFAIIALGPKLARGPAQLSSSPVLFLVLSLIDLWAEASKHQPSQLITMQYKCILLKSAHLVAWPLWCSWQLCPYFSRFAVYDPSNESSESLKHLALQESSSCCQSSINSLGEPILQTVPDQHPEIMLSLCETNLKMTQTINCLNTIHYHLSIDHPRSMYLCIYVSTPQGMYPVKEYRTFKKLYHVISNQRLAGWFQLHQANE